MSVIVRLTSNNGDVLVNFEHVRCILPSGTGSKIFFDLSHYTLVNESPTHIANIHSSLTSTGNVKR